jgi:hypothetical protein
MLKRSSSPEQIAQGIPGPEVRVSRVRRVATSIVQALRLGRGVTAEANAAPQDVRYSAGRRVEPVLGTHPSVLYEQPQARRQPPPIVDGVLRFSGHPDSQRKLVAPARPRLAPLDQKALGPDGTMLIGFEPDLSGVVPRAVGKSAQSAMYGEQPNMPYQQGHALPRPNLDASGAIDFSAGSQGGQRHDGSGK